MKWLCSFFAFFYGLYRDGRACRKLPEPRQGGIKRPQWRDLWVK